MTFSQFAILVVIAALGGALGPWVRATLVALWSWYHTRGRSIVARVAVVIVVVVVSLSIGLLFQMAIYQVGNMTDRISKLEAATAQINAIERMDIGTPAATIPGSAVVAFNSSECPSGWREFAPGRGRTIVGTGRHSAADRYDQELGEWEFSETGGSRTHRLEEAEIPAHRHAYTFSSGRNSPQHVDISSDEFGYKDLPNRMTGAAGGGQPHNNMPPFIALSLCELRPGGTR